MLFKTLLFSILSCSLLGFSLVDDPAKGSKLLRTSEGVIYIPTSANISSQDAKSLQKLLLSESEEIGVLVVNGQITSKNSSVSMSDLREMDMSFEESLTEGQSSDTGIWGRIFGKTKHKCQTAFSESKCTDHWTLIESAVKDMNLNGSVTNGAYEILDKYGYVEIK